MSSAADDGRQATFSEKAADGRWQAADDGRQATFIDQADGRCRLQMMAGKLRLVNKQMADGRPQMMAGKLDVVNRTLALTCYETS